MPAFMNVRKLAALDIVFHGPRLILVEFAIGVLLPLAIGSSIAAAARGTVGANVSAN
jgi:hypothetical protein